MGQPGRRERNRLRDRAVCLQRPSLVNAVQWAVGLELLLLIDDPWRVFLTTDHPNGGGFWRYPEIIGCDGCGVPQGAIRKLPPEPGSASRWVNSTGSTRSPTWPSSRRPVRRGAWPDAEGPSGRRRGRRHHDLFGEARHRRAMFSYPRYVLKGGTVVVEEGEVRALNEGREFLCSPTSIPRIEEFIRPTVSEGLHDVVRELPDGNEPNPASRHRAPLTSRVIGCRMITLTLKEPSSGPPGSRNLLPDKRRRSTKRRSVRCRSISEETVPCRRILHGRGRGERRARDPRRPAQGQWIGRGMTAGASSSGTSACTSAPT